MKIVFFGTPLFAAEVLRFLIQKKVQISAVVTQTDKAQKRSSEKLPSPVKKVALELLKTVPILQPEKASSEEFLEALKALKADLYVVVAYGKILPEKLLSIPPLGCINAHASLLPKYRGAAPIQRCLMNGEKETGIAIQKMVKEMDAGDVILSSKVLISEDMNLAELQEELCQKAKEVLLEVIHMYEKGIPDSVPQNHSEATFAPKILSEDAEIHWDHSSEEIHNLIRSISPKPGAWCVRENGFKIKVLKSKPVDGLSGKSGEIISRKDGIVACGKGALKLISVQPEGKKVMSWDDYSRGAPLFTNFLV